MFMLRRPVILLASCGLLGLAPAASAAPGGACSAPDRPVASGQAPPAWLMGELAVLRRPLAAGDRLPRRVRRRLPLQAFDARHVRALASVEGETSRSFLVPGVDREPHALVPRRCLARMPRSAARRARARNRRVRRRQHMLCLVSVERGGFGAWCRRTSHGPAMLSPASLAGDYETPSLRRLQEVVPDRVAFVEVTLDDGSLRTVTPVDNRWAVLSETDFPPRQVRWLDAAGAEIARHEFSGGARR